MCFTPKEGITMKLKIMTILLLTGLTGGCMATITPDGNIYTEALVPSPTVVVESYSTPVFVSRPHRSAPRPIVVSNRRYGGKTPGHHSSGKPHNSQHPGRR